MGNKKDLEFLKGSTEEHERFHRSRIMFCLRNGIVEVASPNISDSHIEWFEKKGWMTGDNAEEFLDKNIRGFYLPAENKLYCYKGAGWYFDDEILADILARSAELRKKLGLNDDTEIRLGPKDGFINGKECKRYFAGTLKKLSESAKRDKASFG